jgi:hypothetical protein
VKPTECLADQTADDDCLVDERIGGFHPPYKSARWDRWSSLRISASGEFDYDVIIIGSGFGGSVSAMRLTEKG